MTPLMHVENALKLAQPGSALFRYVAKMAAVEYEKCASIHTPRFDHFEYTIPASPFSTLLFAPILIGTLYVRKLSIVTMDSMDIGTQQLTQPKSISSPPWEWWS